MKKYMIADLIKAVEDEQAIERTKRIKDLLDTYGIAKTDAEYIVDNYSKYTQQDLIATAIEEYNLNMGDAEMFVDDYPNQSEWAELEGIAEELGVDITDVEPDDVENINSAGSAKGTIDTSMGIVKYIYNHPLQTYSILLLVDGNPLMYNNIEPYMMNDMINAESFGSYYNDNLRKNDSYEGCGCNANVCELTDIAIFSSIS